MTLPSSSVGWLRVETLESQSVSVDGCFSCFIAKNGFEVQCKAKNTPHSASSWSPPPPSIPSSLCIIITKGSASSAQMIISTRKQQPLALCPLYAASLNFSFEFVKLLVFPFKRRRCALLAPHAAAAAALSNTCLPPPWHARLSRAK